MVEFQEPIPKKFPSKARCQPLPIIVGDLSEETIKSLWPCYIGSLKPNCVVITDENDMKSLHRSGFFGQSAYFDRKKFKPTEYSAKPKRRKKNWDQLIISDSVPNLDACLAAKKPDSGDSSEGKSTENISDVSISETPSRTKKATSDSECSSSRKPSHENSCKINLSESELVEKTEKGMTVELSDSEEEEEEEEEIHEEEENEPDFETMEDEWNKSDCIRDLDTFSHDNTVLNLSFEEAFFLCYALGCLTVLSETEEVLDYIKLFEIFSKADEDFVYKYVTYHHYRSKGWIVKPGIKFGGDFLLYKQGPPFYHASFIIIIDKGNSMSWTTLAGLNRLAGSVNKELIIASVSIPGERTLQDTLSASMTETLYRRWVPTSDVGSAGDHS